MQAINNVGLLFLHITNSIRRIDAVSCRALEHTDIGENSSNFLKFIGSCLIKTF